MSAFFKIYTFSWNEDLEGGGTFLCFVFFLDTCNSLLFSSWRIFSFNSVLINFNTEQNQNERNKSKAAMLQQRQRHWKHLSTFPRGYVEVLTRHTHMVSRKLHRRLSSIHLTSTVCWLKKERKKDWLRASFTAQSQHWSVSFLKERIKTIIKKNKEIKKILKKKRCLSLATTKWEFLCNEKATFKGFVCCV